MSFLFRTGLIFTAVDIFDGDKEPVVYHGKTLTTKVPLRKACEAIAKYAFVVSPYPIIISAEVHCCIPQQDMIASIMREVFGDILVSAPVQGRPKVAVLPSPEDLRGRILLKVCLEARPVILSAQLLYIDEKLRCLGERGNAAERHLYRCRIFDVRGDYHGR
jgi:hypothetical protein